MRQLALGATRSPASMNGPIQALASPSQLLYQGEGLISADLIVNYRQIQAQKKSMNMKIGDFIPMNIKPSADSGYVMSLIADRSLSTLVNQPEIRDSTIGRTANRVEKTFQQEVSFGDKAKNQIEHKFNFEILAFQSLAQLKYQGLTNAAFLYKARTSAFAVEVFEKLPTARAEQLVLSHEVGAVDRLSRLSIRWDW